MNGWMGIYVYIYTQIHYIIHREMFILLYRSAFRAEYGFDSWGQPRPFGLLRVLYLSVHVYILGDTCHKVPDIHLMAAPAASSCRNISTSCYYKYSSLFSFLRVTSGY